MIVLQKRRVRYHRPALPQGVRQRRWHMTRGTHRSHDCGLPVELSRTSQHLIKNKIQQMQQRRRWPKSRHRQPGWAAFGDEVARAPEPNRKKMNIPNLHQPGRPSKKMEGLCRHIVSKPNGNSHKKNSSQPPKPSSRQPKGHQERHLAICKVPCCLKGPRSPWAPLTFAAQNTQPALPFGGQQDETTDGGRGDKRKRRASRRREYLPAEISEFLVNALKSHFERLCVCVW